MDALEAIECLFDQQIKEPAPESLPLEECFGRICAQNVYAATDYPSYRAAVHDGIAVSTDILQACESKESNDSEAVLLQRDEYERISMGAFVDEQWDAVLPLERCDFLPSGQVSISSIPNKRAAITTPGEYVSKDSLICSEGTIITPSHLALLRLLGMEQLTVKGKPKGMVIPIGDDLLTPGMTPEKGKVYECDGIMIKCFIEQAGGSTLLSSPIPDNLDLIKDKMREACAAYDFVVVIGGIGTSGERFKDYAFRAVEELGQVIARGLSIGPGGKPTFLALLDSTIVIGIPGPPHAALTMGEYLIPRLFGKWLGASLVQEHLVSAKLILENDSEQERSKTIIQKDSLATVAVARPGDAQYRRVFLRKTSDGYVAYAGRQGETADVFTLSQGIGCYYRDRSPNDPLVVRLLCDERSIPWL